MNASQTRQTLRKFSVVFITMLVFTSGAAGVGVVTAEDDPPGEPVNFFGEIETEDGTPAPVGTEVFAIVDDSVEDSIEVEEAGQYGGPDTFDEKLAVNSGAGDEVEFAVAAPNGPTAFEVFELNGQDGVEEFDLTFEAGAFDADPAAFDVSIDTAASTLEADAGDDLEVIAEIENTGDFSDEQEITATVLGDTVGTTTVSLDGGSSDTVAFDFEALTEYDGEDVEVASDDESDTATLTVTDDDDPADDDPAAFDVAIDTAASTLEADAGDDLEVVAEIENTGDLDGEQEITATVLDDTVGTTSVSLDGGASDTVAFDFEALTEYDGEDVEVSSEDDTDTATLTVTDDTGVGGGGGGGGGAAPADPAVFEVSELDPVDVAVEQGEQIDVSATITNTGGQATQGTVEFRIDDTTIADESLVLADGNSETIVFENIETGDLDAGDYEHGIFTDDDSQTGTLTVTVVDDDDPDGDDDDTGADDDDTGADDDDDTDDDDDAGVGDDDDDTDDDDTDVGDDDTDDVEDDTPGFGVVVAFVALLAGALLATRRRN